ncbi:hypothetical protein NQ317_014890, partial [Molorchus minor]
MGVKTPLFICNTNTLGHIDYGIPIVANKSTDYRTSTSLSHQYIPTIPQEFDCRVPRKIKPELLEKNVALRDGIRSIYNIEYVKKSKQDNQARYGRGVLANEIHYLRSLQEKMFIDPPAPMEDSKSEAKDAYTMKFYVPKYREVLPPAISARCEIIGLGRPLQPTISPGSQGFWKYLDIYMTDNRLRYPMYTSDQVNMAKEDFPTFYSGSGKYKTLNQPLPGPLTGNKSVWDKTFFKFQFPPKLLSRAPKHVPNLGLRSEYMANYQFRTDLDTFPYRDQSGVLFGDSLSDASAWQNLCPPGMYCTEQCHIGTGWPVRMVVDTGKSEKEPVPRDP